MKNDIKKEMTLKKKADFSWNLHPLEAECGKSNIHVQPLISGVNFSNNRAKSQARVNMSETEHDTTFETSSL